MMDKVLKAIRTRWANSTLFGDLGALNYGSAVDGKEGSYATYFVVDDRPEYTFTESYENIYVQFDIWADTDSIVTASQLSGRLHTLYDNCSMDIEGGYLVWMKRIQHVPRSDPDGGWHMVSRYEMQVEVL